MRLLQGASASSAAPGKPGACGYSPAPRAPGAPRLPCRRHDRCADQGQPEIPAGVTSMMPYDTYRMYQVERAKGPGEIQRSAEQAARLASAVAWLFRAVTRPARVTRSHTGQPGTMARPAWQHRPPAAVSVISNETCRPARKAPGRTWPGRPAPAWGLNMARAASSRGRRHRAGMPTPTASTLPAAIRPGLRQADPGAPIAGSPQELHTFYIQPPHRCIHLG
jgi:hypothetical protein